jgi:cobalamin biosynthesis Mg chelatase CobN
MRQRIIKLLTTMAFVPALFIGTAPLALADGASTTGPNSGVTVNSSSSTTINNSNNVTVTNTSSQTATSGNATVSNNTTGGNATSGNASNSNTTSTSGGGNPNQGGAGGQVLGASFTVASIAGGRGAAFSTLPNTGLRDGINAWLVATILTLAASVLYWNKVIAPRLKNV